MSIKKWVEERRGIHSAATDGPWYKTPNDRILSESVQWPEGDDYDVAGGLGRHGAVVEAIHDFDGNAIVDAHNNLPRALDALNAVLELHEPINGFVGDPSHWECNVCGDERGPKPYPCPTVRAVEGAISDE